MEARRRKETGPLLYCPFLERSAENHFAFSPLKLIFICRKQDQNGLLVSILLKSVVLFSLTWPFFVFTIAIFRHHKQLRLAKKLNGDMGYRHQAWADKQRKIRKYPNPINKMSLCRITKNVHIKQNACI